jgi:3-methyladenine DNA glycosylase AlkC
VNRFSLRREIQRLKKLANSSDWVTREGAAFALRDLLEESFDDGMKLTEQWAADPSERIRRAACLGCMQRKKVTTPIRVRRVLKRLEQLMTDESLYVRKCCGPFVVGYLGYTYPDISLPWLRRQAQRRDLNVRANVAKAFSQALGKAHPREGLEILNVIADDNRLRVRSAVLSSLRNIIRRGGATQTDLQAKFPALYLKVVS